MADYTLTKTDRSKTTRGLGSMRFKSRVLNWSAIFFLAAFSSPALSQSEKTGTAAALTGTFPQTSAQPRASGSAQGSVAVECLRLDGLESRDEVANPVNVVVNLDIGPGNQLTGIGWDFGLETIGGSWLSEAAIHLSDTTGADSDPNTVSLNAGVGEEASGDMDFSSQGLVDFASNALQPVTVGPGGILQVQLAEDFVDNPGQADAVYRTAANPALCPGLALICSDQAACNSAISGEIIDNDIIFADSFGDALPPTDPPVDPPISGRLNDTGIDWCADANTNNLDCPVADFPGQDGEFGRDALERTGQLDKVGDGTAGFDFTKLDANGNDVPVGATNWSCVRDNQTGLIWEVKTVDGGLRDKSHGYSWYDPNPNTNGGDSGIRDGGTCVGSDCDTTGYTEAVNQQGLCGASDWRLPSVDELVSLIHHGGRIPAIDTDYFPNTPNVIFWSATASAGDPGFAWGIFAQNAAQWPHEFSSKVRLVRSGQ